MRKGRGRTCSAASAARRAAAVRACAQPSSVFHFSIFLVSFFPCSHAGPVKPFHAEMSAPSGSVPLLGPGPKLLPRRAVPRLVLMAAAGERGRWMERSRWRHQAAVSHSVGKPSCCGSLKEQWRGVQAGGGRASRARTESRRPRRRRRRQRRRRRRRQAGRPPAIPRVSRWPSDAAAALANGRLLWATSGEECRWAGTAGRAPAGRAR